MTANPAAKNSREDFLRAARKLFPERGYSGTTTRAIAQEAGHDQALIRRYFGGKEGLFIASTEVKTTFTQQQWGSPECVTDNLVSTYFRTWEDDSTALAMLKASATNAHARERFVDNYTRQVLPALTAVAADQSEERASLWSAMIMGVALNRLVLKYEPLASMSREDLRHYLESLVSPILTGPLTAPPALPPR